MVQALKKKLKNEKGFTLIELLAVIVILGIIAAIAIPSIMGIMGNTKKDAHISNAQQMANSAKIYINDNKLAIGASSSSPTTVYLSDMISSGIMDNIKDPSAASGATDPNYGADSSDNAKNCSVSVYKSGNNVIYKVKLVSSTGTVYASGTRTPSGGGTATDVDAFSLQRSDITLP